MKKKGLFTLLFLISFSIIFIIPFGSSGYIYNEDSYQVNESLDDAVYYVGFNYYDTDNFLMITSNLYDVKTGIVFNNISIFENASFTEAYLSLYSNDSYTDELDYWVTIYGIDEDNTSSFSDFEDFNNRSYTSNHVNWNVEDLEGLDTWVNSSNLANIFNEIKARSGWSNESNIGLYILSVQSSNSYRMSLSYDGNSSYAPKLYLKWRYKLGVDEEEGYDFYERYKDYDIYNTTIGGGEGEGTYSITAHDIGYDHDLAFNPLDCPPYRWSGYLEGVNVHAISLVRAGSFRVYTAVDDETLTWYEYSFTDPLLTSWGGSTFNTWYQNDTVYVVHKKGAWSNNLVYAELDVNSQGNVTVRNNWNIVFTAPATEGIWGLGIVVTKNDDIYIATYQRDSGVDVDYKLFKNDAIDGSWNTASGYPKIWRNIGYEPQLRIACEQLGDDGLLIAWSQSTSPEQFSSIEYDGSSFSNERIDFEDHNIDSISKWSLSLYPSGIEGGGITYEDSAGVIYFIPYNEDTHNWDSDITVYDMGSSYNIEFITLGIKDDEIAVIWGSVNNEFIPDDDSIIYMYSINDGLNWRNNTGGSIPEDWIDSDLEYNSINGFVHEQGNYAGVVWIHDDSSIWYASLGLDFEEGGDAEQHFYIYDDDGELVKYCLEDIEDVHDWIDEDIKDKQYQNLGNTISWMLGLMGLIMMPLGFVLFVSQAQKGDYSNAFLYLMISFLIGMSLFVGWLWG